MGVQLSPPSSGSNALRVVPDARRSLEDTLTDLAPRVKAWLCRDLGQNDVDDALQDALTEIAKALPKFRGDSHIDTYAYRITMRVGLRYHKARKRRREHIEIAPPPADSIDPESRAMSREALRALYRGLDQLATKRRRAFILCCIEGLSAPEAAERERTRPDAMRSRLRHARADLAKILSRDPYLCDLLERCE